MTKLEYVDSDLVLLIMIFSPDIDIHALKDELKNEIKHEIKEHFLNKVVPSFDTPDDDYFNR